MATGDGKDKQFLDISPGDCPRPLVHRQRVCRAKGFLTTCTDVRELIERIGRSDLLSKLQEENVNTLDVLFAMDDAVLERLGFKLGDVTRLRQEREQATAPPPDYQVAVSEYLPPPSAPVATPDIAPGWAPSALEAGNLHSPPPATIAVNAASDIPTVNRGITDELKFQIGLNIFH